MGLIEREVFLASLQKHSENVAGGEGHCILVTGEAGIGKTALIKAFCKQQTGISFVYQGTCDALFTPRPLAPLYDILWQVNRERWPVPPVNEERSTLFSNFFHELVAKKEPVLIVFEDIHWADEGTLDFIKFFVRRIEKLPCLFIVTYRDNEIWTKHPLRNVLGQLPPDSITKIGLSPLSKQAVMGMATRKGYDGEEVYTISGGNPFYVNEILASYSPGVPDNIKDSILAVFERQQEGTKNAWEVWSVMPEGLEVERVAKIKSNWDINHCFAINVIVVQNGKVVFKHELYRRTIEESLTPIKRIMLNKMVLELFLASFEENGEIERILHYAKNANEKELVMKYAPEAAKKAATIGAHKESSRLYLTAIENCESRNSRQLAALYEAYAYECYLCNQIEEAIAFTEKVLGLWQQFSFTREVGNSLRFLSRLWWYSGNRKNAESFGLKAIETLANLPASDAKAMAFSNMSQLKMLSDEPAECISWGEKAIAMAKELDNQEILSHALNNVGTVQMMIPLSAKNGELLLQQSLDLALKNSFHEHAARAYTNLASCLIKLKNPARAKTMLELGIHYCEERDLNTWTDYLLSWKARLELDQGNWAGAYTISENLLKIEHQPGIIRTTAILVMAKIKMRRGEDALSLLRDANALSFETMELQRIIPSLIAMLEYEWITGETVIGNGNIEQATTLMESSGIAAEKHEFAFWMKKAGRPFSGFKNVPAFYDLGSSEKIMKAAGFWEQLGYSYEQALVLFEGKDEDKRTAIAMMQDLGATALYRKMKQAMKDSGMKNIPRGIRNSTRSNAALLTGREMDVLALMKEELQNKEIAARLFISAKTVDHHISSILFKLDAPSRLKAVSNALRLGLLK